jgi:hypothetical protein
MIRTVGLLILCALVAACATAVEPSAPPPAPPAPAPAEPAADADPVPEARPTAPVEATGLPPATPR